jgi:hypothetical protein
MILVEVLTEPRREPQSRSWSGTEPRHRRSPKLTHMSGKTNRAHGEAKTLTAWARDERCVVTVNTLRTRIAAGWKIEEALATPGWRRRRGGLTPEEAAALKAANDLVRSLPRVHRNTRADAPELAATKALNELLRHAATRTTTAEISRIVGLSHESVRRRIRGD